MTDLAILIVCGYMILSFGVGVLVGKMFKGRSDGDG